MMKLRIRNLMMGLIVKKLFRSMMNHVQFFPPSCKEKVTLKCSVMFTYLSIWFWCVQIFRPADLTKLILVVQSIQTTTMIDLPQIKLTFDYVLIYRPTWRVGLGGQLPTNCTFFWSFFFIIKYYLRKKILWIRQKVIKMRIF